MGARTTSIATPNQRATEDRILLCTTIPYCTNADRDYPHAIFIRVSRKMAPVFYRNARGIAPKNRAAALKNLQFSARDGSIAAQPGATGDATWSSPRGSAGKVPKNADRLGVPDALLRCAGK